MSKYKRIIGSRAILLETTIIKGAQPLIAEKRKLPTELKNQILSRL